MPVFSVGFMRCMHSWDDIPLARIPAESQERMNRVVKSALDLGLDHFETARGYGTSEIQLGQALLPYARDRYILQTKILPTADPEAFTAAVHDSLGRLRTGYVDLLAIHGINDHRSLWHACRRGGCLAAARRLQEQGNVRGVGFSSHGSTDVILSAIRHQDDGGFDFVNLHWYYIFQRHWPAIAEASERDMGVFIISPNDKGGMLHTPPPLLASLSDPLSPMQFNDLFCLGRPEVSTLGIGASEPDDFGHHLDVLRYLNSPGNILDPIDSRWRRAMADATGHERPDAQWETLPGWEETPGYINMPFILWLYNLARGWDLTAYARKRYAHLGRDLPWVPGNDGSTLDRYDVSDVLGGRPFSARDVVSLLGKAHEMLSAS